MFSGSTRAIVGVALLAACLAISVDAGRDDLPDSKQNGYAVQGGCTRDYDVDYLDLAVSWGPGACQTDKVQCKRQIDNRFTIHGLWPQHHQHSTPIDCCTKTFFDYGDVTTLKNDLRAHWPTLENGSDDYRFWAYEWNKHGSCATRIRGISQVRDFFDFSLKSYQRWNYEAILRRKGITPSSVATYWGSDIVATLTQGIGAAVTIDCGASKNNPNVLMLTQIHVCFNTQLQLIDCKKNTSKKCRSKLIFPVSK